MIAHISARRGRSPPFTQNLLVHGYQNLLVHGYQNLLVHGYQNLLVHGYQNLWFMGIKTFWFMGIKPFGSNPLVHGSQKISQKKEDIKMDDQKKIKILKYFDHGLQNKNKNSKIF